MWQSFTVFTRRNPSFYEFDKLPVVKQWNYGRRAWKIIAVGFAIAAGSVILLSRPIADPQFGHAIPLLILLVGFVIAVAGTSFLFMRGEIHIDQESVAVDQVHLWRHYRWVAPLAEFHGVGLWADDHSERRGRLDVLTIYKLYSVVLVHPDPGKTIWLYHSRSRSRAQELKELASQLLHLHALGN